MSDSDSKPSGGRPSKVTLAASLGGASCAVLIFSLFDTLGNLRTVEMRDQVAKTMSEPPFDTMTLSTADVLAGMRVMVFIAGALAAAGVVLAVYVARRHRGARIGFTVVAALLLLTTPVAGMLTFLVGIAALLLWGEPARAWFGGREPKPDKPRRQEALMSAGDRSSGSSGGSSGPPSWPYGPQGGGDSSGEGSDPTSGTGSGSDGDSGSGGDSGPGGASAWGTPPPQAPQSDSPQPPPYSGSYGAAGGASEAPRPEQSGDQSSDQSGQGSEQGQAPEQPAQWSGQQGQGQQGQGGQPWQQQGQGQQGQEGQQGQGQWSDAGQQPYGQGQQGGHGSYGAAPAPYAQQTPYGHQAPYGSPYGQDQQQLYGSPYGQDPHGSSYSYPGYGGEPGKRPGTVTIAAVLTFLGSAIGLLMGLLLMLALSTGSSAIEDQLRRDPNFEQLGMDLDQVFALMWVMAVVLVIWCLAAIVLAAFTLRRQQWARWLLVGSAAASALLSLLAALGTFGLTLIVTIPSVATIVLLFAGGANDWFAGRDRNQQPPSGPQWSSSPGPW